MERQPLTIYATVEPKEGTDKKPYRYECGTLWPHKTGDGYDVVIPPGISISGRLKAFPRTAKEQTPEE